MTTRRMGRVAALLRQNTGAMVLKFNWCFLPAAKMDAVSQGTLGSCRSCSGVGSKGPYDAFLPLPVLGEEVSVLIGPYKRISLRTLPISTIRESRRLNTVR